MTQKRCLALAVPCMFVAGCADTIHTESDDRIAIEHGEAYSVEPGGPARPFEAFIYIESPSCDAPVAAYEADARYIDDGTPLSLIRCLWTFDDGTTSPFCAGQHVFAEGGFHDFTLEVEDLSTGAITYATARRFVDYPLEADLEVSTPECGLEISWVATVNVSAEVRVFIEPFDRIVTDDPFYYLRRAFTVGVTEPGTYGIVMTAEHERPAGPICSARIQREVTVTACHDHTPTCKH